MRSDGVFHPIDFANANPDSQVTSLHFHIPWLVKSLLRWSLFCVVTDRPMRYNLDWAPFYEVAADPDRSYRERLAGYAAIANERFETDRFQEFCDNQLSHLDEVALEYFGTDRAREAIRRKVAQLFPEAEVDRFTDHFAGLVDFWRSTEQNRLSAGA